MIYILLTFLILLILFQYGSLKRNQCYISLISTVVITASIFCAAISSKLWGLTLSGYTAVIIFSGCIIMYVSECVGCKLAKRNRRVGGDTFRVIRPIRIGKIRNSLIIGLSVIGTVMYTMEVLKAGKGLGASGLAALGVVKHSYINNAYSGMSFIPRQMYKVVLGISINYCFIFANNIVADKKNRASYYTYLIPVLSAIIVVVASGSRTDIMKIISALFIDYFVISKVDSNTLMDKSGMKRVIFWRGIPFAIAFSYFSYLMKDYIKVSGTKSAQNIIGYILYYIGSSIAVLNKKVDMAYSNGGFWIGKGRQVNTFVLLGNLDYGGNVATIFEGIINVGFWRELIYIFLLYSISAFILHSILNGYRLKRNHNTKLIAYSFLFHFHTMAYYADFCSYFFRHISEMLVLAMVVLFSFVMFVKVKVRN